MYFLLYPLHWSRKNPKCQSISDIFEEEYYIWQCAGSWCRCDRKCKYIPAEESDSKALRAWNVKTACGNIQSTRHISLYCITRYYTQHGNYYIRTTVILWTEKRHLIYRPLCATAVCCEYFGENNISKVRRIQCALDISRSFFFVYLTKDTP